MVSKAEQKYDCRTEANQQQKDKGKKEKKTKAFSSCAGFIKRKSK